jgi:hypothetical protein
MPGSQGWWRRPVAEFVAIFAGVTLSLLADDWRDRRADARAELAALHLIAADLVRDSTEIEHALHPATLYQAPALWAIAHWDDRDVDVEDFALRLFPLSDFNPYRPQSAAYSGLKESGGLDLIQNATLRNAMVEYFDYTQTQLVNYIDWTNQAYRDFFGRMSRYALLPEPRSPDRAYPWAGPWRLRAAWPEIRRDTELANLIQFMGAWGYVLEARRISVLEANLTLRTQITQELGSR